LETLDIEGNFFNFFKHKIDIFLTDKGFITLFNGIILSNINELSYKNLYFEENLDYDYIEKMDFLLKKNNNKLKRKFCKELLNIYIEFHNYYDINFYYQYKDSYKKRKFY
jgi:hypothetical protein